VSDGEAGLDRILPANDMDVRTADGRQADADDGLAGSGARNGFFFHPEFAWAAEDVGLHEAAPDLPRGWFFDR
jgi:hypothetical protein